MSAINKELYDALILAKVREEKATAAAKPFNEDFKAKTGEDIAPVKIDIADIKARVALAEKLQWGILIGVVGLIIKSFLG